MHTLVLPTWDDGIEDKEFMRQTGKNQLGMFIHSFNKHLLSANYLSRVFVKTY